MNRIIYYPENSEMAELVHGIMMDYCQLVSVTRSLRVLLSQLKAKDRLLFEETVRDTEDMLKDIIEEMETIKKEVY